MPAKLRGRILFYNSSNGDGKIITETEEIVPFNADHWRSFDLFPEAKLDVEIELDSQGNITAITSAKKYDKKKESSKKEQTATFSIEECIKSYFEPVEFLIDKPPPILKTYEQLDFFRSRRFLTTAYNDLKAIDPSMHNDDELIAYLEKVEGLYKSYKIIENHTLQIKLAFEVIFLRSQPEYLMFIKYKEQCLSRVSALSQKEETLFPQIRQKEEMLKNIKEGDSTEKAALESEIKKIKRMYVDTIHENAQIGEELSTMTDMKIRYTESYFDEFVLEFTRSAQRYLDLIGRILNYKAYSFDKTLWTKARQSKAIREYFHEANIQGDYSTETFLRYYLNTIDKSKANEEQLELFELLAYLQQQKDSRR